MVDVGYPQDKQARTQKKRHLLIALPRVQGRISMANLQQIYSAIRDCNMQVKNQ